MFNQQGTLTVNASEISGNSADRGGGIDNAGASTTTLTNSTVSGNAARAGAGIIAYGTLTATNVTISGNAATGVGGGLITGNAASNASVTGGTITANTASSGGGVYSTDAAISVKNTIISGNSASSGADCEGGLSSAGRNLIFNLAGCTAGGDIISGQDPKLGPLADNGGPTKTHTLFSGSPAIDTGLDCPPPDTDQRGVSRPQGAACDIGAFELEGIARLWGDFDCSGALTIGDAQKIARFLISLTISQAAGCPQPSQTVALNGGPGYKWGDLDCSGDVTIGDAQKTARKLIDLSVGQAPGCPAPGETVDVTTG